MPDAATGVDATTADLPTAVEVCSPPQIFCDRRCVDLMTSAIHCGACGNACPVAQQCVAGRCAPCGALGQATCAPGVCLTGLTGCTNVCRDTRADARNCGMCGRSCAAGERCEGGVCRRSGSLWVTARGAFARFPDGSLRAWGDNSTGQLGDGTMVSRPRPSPTMAPADAEEIVGGAFHTCARLTDGTVSCWGSHRGGQLGLGPVSTAPVLVPTRVPGLTGVVSLAAGPYHTCAVRGDGVVLCWGGGGDRISARAAGQATVPTTPTPVPGLSGTFVAVTAGWGHSCGRRMGGAVFCWGINGAGQLGAGTTTGVGPAMVATVNAVDIAAGYFNTCARLADGTVRCWGYNGYGQLGDGTATNRATPVAFPLPGPAEEVQIGGAFTCARLRTGAVQCAGYNMFGGIGDGTNVQRMTPTAVRGITDAVALSSHSGAHTCVRLAAGGILCWGDNRYGQLGDGTTTSRNVPVAVSGT